MVTRDVLNSGRKKNFFDAIPSGTHPQIPKTVSSVAIKRNELKLSKDVNRNS